MSIKISDIYGKPIFSGEGQQVGTVRDVIIDMEEGKAVRLTTEEMSRLSKEEVRTTLKDKSILYDRVRTVGDIVLLKGSSRVGRSSRETRSSENTGSGSFGSFMSR